jgi:hypothetical protein
MEMRAEERPRDHPETETIDCLPEERSEGRSIGVVDEDEDSAGPAAGDVKEAVGKIASRSARHV